jgi:metallo-beta-lactamase class B
MLSKRGFNLTVAAALTFTAKATSLGVATRAHSQTLPPNLPTKEDLAKDNNLFLTLARKALKWDEPTDPIKLIGPLYFVGTAGLSSWLFTTAEGHIPQFVMPSAAVKPAQTA